MPSTKRGVFHNIRESKYTISNGEIVFFFSSETYRKKFMGAYKENRENFVPDEEKDIKRVSLIADIYLYLCVEKRGFYVWYKENEIDVFDLYQLALEKIDDEQPSPEWKRIYIKSEVREGFNG